MSVAGRVIVYGGRGALGSTVVSVFKKNQFWVCNIDMQVCFSPVLYEEIMGINGAEFYKVSHDPKKKLHKPQALVAKTEFFFNI